MERRWHAPLARPTSAQLATAMLPRQMHWQGPWPPRCPARPAGRRPSPGSRSRSGRRAYGRRSLWPRVSGPFTSDWRLERGHEVAPSGRAAARPGPTIYNAGWPPGQWPLPHLSDPRGADWPHWPQTIMATSVFSLATQRRLTPRSTRAPRSSPLSSPTYVRASSSSTSYSAALPSTHWPHFCPRSSVAAAPAPLPLPPPRPRTRYPLGTDRRGVAQCAVVRWLGRVPWNATGEIVFQGVRASAAARGIQRR
jgi:hypothetical protein